MFAKNDVQLNLKRSLVWEKFLGVNAHFLWFQPEDYVHQMEMLDDLNIKWVRVDLHWDRHEKTANKYDLKLVDELVKNLNSHQLKSLFYLVGSAPFASSAPPNKSNTDQYPPTNPKLFAQRMALLAKKYPRINSWQIWNEPNLPAYWQPKEDPLAYGQLLRESVHAIRSVTPNKEIVMGGMAYYSQMPNGGSLMFEALQKLGVFSLDTVVAYHPYSHYPEGDDIEEQDFIHRATLINKRLRAAGVAKIWSTEWGWSSYKGPVEHQPQISEQTQAEYLLKRLALMSALDYEKVFVFALSDLDSRASTRDQYYGLLTLNGEKKPAYTALKNFLNFTGPELTPVQPVEVEYQGEGLISIVWNTNESTMLAFWGKGKGVAKIKCKKSARLYNPFSDLQRRLGCVGGELEFNVTESLQLIKLTRSN